jgi:hypothetical protein
MVSCLSGLIPPMVRCEQILWHFILFLESMNIKLMLQTRMGSFLLTAAHD